MCCRVSYRTAGWWKGKRKSGWGTKLLEVVSFFFLSSRGNVTSGVEVKVASYCRMETDL